MKIKLCEVARPTKVVSKASDKKTIFASRVKALASSLPAR
jgi:hypothetical protein